jgi:hypothetical protein
MKRWVRIGAGVAGAVAAGSVAAAAVGTSAWSRATARTVARLNARTHARTHARLHARTHPPADEDGGAASTAPVRTFEPAMLAGLPAPVVRYFEFALTPGQRLVRAARLEQAGSFAMKRDAWVPFTATEHLTARPAGFVWDARIRMVPLIPALVRDSYIGGKGAMLGTMAGVVPLVNQHGTASMAAGALMRYLAEAVWLPTALLPANGVTWEGIDDSTARATLVDGATRVSLDFRFAPDGRVTGTRGERLRDDGGRSTLLPWVGRHEDYERVQGMMIPRRGEVGWIMPDGPFAYWRGRQVAVTYEWEE